MIFPKLFQGFHEGFSDVSHLDRDEALIISQLNDKAH